MSARAALLALPLLACEAAGSGAIEDKPPADTGAAADGGDGADGADGADGSGGADGGADGTDGGADGTDGGGDGADGGGDGADGSGDGADGGDPDLRPVEGAWDSADATVADDPCGLGNFQDPTGLIPSAYEIAHDGPSAFTLGPEGGPADRCEMVGPGFSCAEGSFTESLGSFGLSGDLVFATVLTGEVDASREAISARTDLTVTCEGRDCYLLEFVLDFPCPLAVDLQLQAR
jgi:hypothetical protein